MRPDFERLQMFHDVDPEGFYMEIRGHWDDIFQYVRNLEERLFMAEKNTGRIDCKQTLQSELDCVNEYCDEFFDSCCCDPECGEFCRVCR